MVGEANFAVEMEIEEDWNDLEEETRAFVAEEEPVLYRRYGTGEKVVHRSLSLRLARMDAGSCI